MRRQRAIVTMLGAVILLIGTVVVARRTVFSGPSYCTSLSQDVEGLDHIEWSNHITAAGAAWEQALTDGVVQASPSSRRAVAAAVRGDPGGYHQIRVRADASLLPALDRLHALALDPVAAQRHRHDRQVDRDVATFYASMGGCRFAP